MRAICLVLLAVILPLAVKADPQSDAAIRKKLIGYWRSPRHDYQFTADGGVIMDPSPPCTTTGTWAVKNGIFYEDGTPYTIRTLTAKRFVYEGQNDQDRGRYVMKRITKAMVGQGYEPSSIR